MCSSDLFSTTPIIIKIISFTKFFNNAFHISRSRCHYISFLLAREPRIELGSLVLETKAQPLYHSPTNFGVSWGLEPLPEESQSSVLPTTPRPHKLLNLHYLDILQPYFLFGFHPSCRPFDSYLEW